MSKPTAAKKTINESDYAGHLLACATFGTLAFKAGRGSAPCLDRDFMAFFAQFQFQSGQANRFLQEFLNAWHAANVAEPLPA